MDSPQRLAFDRLYSDDVECRQVKRARDIANREITDLAHGMANVNILRVTTEQQLSAVQQLGLYNMFFTGIIIVSPSVSPTAAYNFIASNGHSAQVWIEHPRLSHILHPNLTCGKFPGRMAAYHIVHPRPPADAVDQTMNYPLFYHEGEAERWFGTRGIRIWFGYPGLQIWRVYRS